MTTQNEILSILEEETGGAKWTVTKSSTDEQYTIGEAKLAKGDFSAFGNLLKVYIFKDGQTPLAEVEANEELELPEEDLRGAIKAVL